MTPSTLTPRDDQHDDSTERARREWDTIPAALLASPTRTRL